MALVRNLPYLGCHFQVRWSPGEEPPAGSGFSEVVLPPLVVDAVAGGDSGANFGTPAVVGGAPSGPSAGSGSLAAATGGGSGGASAAAAGGAGAANAPLLVLRRGFIGTLEIYQWWNDLRLGKDKRSRTLCVDLLDGERGVVVCTWEFAGARPVQLDYSPLQALDASVLVETVTLSFDSMTMK